MKSVIEGWKGLSFNQKASNLIQGGLLIVGLIVAVATWLGYLESKKERIKAEGAFKETQNLTEKNKQIAIKTVELIRIGLSGTIGMAEHNSEEDTNASILLLKEAGVSPFDINKLFGRTNAVLKP